MHLEFAQQVHMRRLAILQYGREDLKCLEGEGLRPACWYVEIKSTESLLVLDLRRSLHCKPEGVGTFN